MQTTIQDVMHDAEGNIFGLVYLPTATVFFRIPIRLEFSRGDYYAELFIISSLFFT